MVIEAAFEIVRSRFQFQKGLSLLEFQRLYGTEAQCEAALEKARWPVRAVTTANCQHEAIVIGGKHPNDLPRFHWINTMLSKLKTSFSGTFHAFNFNNYARRYLGGYCYRFNRRFSLAEMTERIAKAVSWCMPCTERDLRVAEAHR